MHLLMEQWRQIRVHGPPGAGHGAQIEIVSFQRPSADGGFARAGGDADGDAVEPVAQQCPAGDAARLSRQDEEGGLEGVFGVLRDIERSPAHGQDHGPMSLHQRGEGRLIPSGGEPLEELSVGQFVHLRIGERAQVAKDGVQVLGAHARTSPGRAIL
jgi:hypothetical protein